LSAYIVRRLMMMVVVILLVSIICFMLIQLIPGDPVVAMLGLNAKQQQIEILRHELWLDRPIIVQYAHWMGNVLKGDFGTSISYQEKVINLISSRLPVTLYLASLSLILSMILGIGAGIISAVRRGSFIDQGIVILANTGIAIPVFWLGILGIYFFGLKLGWLPIQGYTSPTVDFWHSTKQLVMPVVCMAVGNLAMLTRQMRSSMLEVIHQDYIRTAESKGLLERVILVRHALKNALIPIITLLGLYVPSLFGGAVLVETVFNIPGMGRLLIQGVFNKDFIVVQACVLIIGVIVSLVNILVDVAYGWLDPRIRFQ
jgi:peptide/nickel transport system permease protein